MSAQEKTLALLAERSRQLAAMDDSMADLRRSAKATCRCIDDLYRGVSVERRVVIHQLMDLLAKDRAAIGAEFDVAARAYRAACAAMGDPL